MILLNGKREHVTRRRRVQLTANSRLLDLAIIRSLDPHALGKHRARHSALSLAFKVYHGVLRPFPSAAISHAVTECEPGKSYYGCGDGRSPLRLVCLRSKIKPSTRTRKAPGDPDLLRIGSMRPRPAHSRKREVSPPQSFHTRLSHPFSRSNHLDPQLEVKKRASCRRSWLRSPRVQTHSKRWPRPSMRS